MYPALASASVVSIRSGEHESRSARDFDVTAVQEVGKLTMRNLLLAFAAFGLAACGDVASDLERVKQDAVEYGQQALEAGAGAVDTRTACMLAGQSEAFCGCVQERLGAEITAEHVEAIAQVARETLSGRGVEAAAQGAENIDASTRDAMVQCATHAAIQGAISEGGN